MRIETFLCRSFDDKEHDVYVWDESTRQEKKDQTLPFKLPGWIVAETLDYLREQVILIFQFVRFHAERYYLIE